MPTKYYNNEMFDGAPINKVSELIDFDWQNDNPIEEINHDNYSIVYNRNFIIKVSKDMLEAPLLQGIFSQLFPMMELNYI